MNEHEPRWLIRHNALANALGVSHSQLTRMVADGLFPLPIEYSPGVRGGAKAYLVPEIIGWVKARLKRREEDALVREARGYEVYRPADAEETLPAMAALVSTLGKLESSMARETDETIAA